jgi:hypothetical protein
MLLIERGFLLPLPLAGEGWGGGAAAAVEVKYAVISILA